MKIKLTKKGKIVLFVVLGIIVLGSGGYLLWRVLQPSDVGPTDSDAGGDYGGSCSNGCSGNTGDSCTYSSETGSCSLCQCSDGVWIKVCLTPSHSSCSDACDICGHGEEPINTPECSSGSQCAACQWPNVGYCNSSGKCTCVKWDSFGTEYTGDSQPQCNYGETFNCEAKCPSGQVECSAGESGCTTVKKDCVCPECNNKTYDTISCKTPTEENICEGSSWIEKPSGTYESCEGITASVDATDPDGISTGSISMKVNGQAKTGFTTGSTTSGTSITYTFSSTDCTQPGEYTISFDWKDAGGNSGTECSLFTSFTIAEEDEPYCGDGIKQSDEVCDPKAEGADSQCTNNVGETVACSNDCTCPTANECGDGILSDSEQCELGDPTGYSCLWSECDQDACTCPGEQENPDWNIVKTASEQCIEEGEQTYAKATYTITVTNVGEGEGNIDKVVDKLDDKVLETYLNSISGDGAYASGLITWDLESDEETFTPDESMQFTYYIKIPSSAYGTYQNTVTAYPTEGDTFSDDADVNLTCDIPQTGIFDSVLAKIAAGIILILIGANWGNLSKLNYTIKDIVSNNRIKNFERKVVKDK